MKLTKRDTERLFRVHPDLVKVINEAAALYPGTFIVTEGLRTPERQKLLVEKGASKTAHSRHVAENNVCKVSCAIDLAVIVSGEARWEGSLYIDLAEIVARAATKVGVKVEWGGSWTQINDGDDLAQAQSDYVARKKRKGEKPLIDGPHFQLPWGVYP